MYLLRSCACLCCLLLNKKEDWKTRWGIFHAAFCAHVLLSNLWPNEVIRPSQTEVVYRLHSSHAPKTNSCILVSPHICVCICSSSSSSSLYLKLKLQLQLGAMYLLSKCLAQRRIIHFTRKICCYSASAATASSSFRLHSTDTWAGIYWFVGQHQRAQHFQPEMLMFLFFFFFLSFILFSSFCVLVQSWEKCNHIWTLHRIRDVPQPTTATTTHSHTHTQK